MTGLFQPPGRNVWMFRFQRNRQRKAVSMRTTSKREAKRRARALLENPNHEPIAVQKCKTCRQEKPADKAHFAPDSRSGKLSPTCRDCFNGAKRKRSLRHSGGVEIAGVKETRDAVAKAFRERDPDGSETLAARERLMGVVSRFGKMPRAEKLEVVFWFQREFLKAE